MNTVIDPDLNDWLTLIKGEFREMPGLHLTKPQFRRLWGLDAVTCDALLDALQSSHFLRPTADGNFALDEAAFARRRSSRSGRGAAHPCAA